MPSRSFLFQFRPVPRSPWLRGAWLYAALAGLAGCTTDYIESTVRIASAEVGARPHFRWQRSSSLRIAEASAVYVAIEAAGHTMPSNDHQPTFRDFTANDLPWRLARLLGDGWRGPFQVAIGARPETVREAMASAATVGATYVASARMRDDGGPRGLWHRRTFTLELELIEASTGRTVDRILLDGRAALDKDEVPERALVSALNDLARSMVGDSRVTDDRLGYLF